MTAQPRLRLGGMPVVETRLVFFMVANLAVEGLPDDVPMKGAVHRWITRLELAHALTRCDVRVKIAPTLFGLGQRVQVDLEISGPTGPVTIHRDARFHDETELFFLISNAFRAASHQLEHGAMSTPA